MLIIEEQRKINTQAHILINTALLTRRKSSVGVYIAIIFAAVLPDLPMFVFFVVEGLGLGFGNPILWEERYFTDTWTEVFAIFNSIPLALLVLLGGYVLKKLLFRVFGWSLLFHLVADFFLHHDDGHPHFFPFSDFIFSSPVSYWDSAHYGTLASSIESALSIVCAAILFFRVKKPVARASLIILSLLLIAAFVLNLAYGLY